MLKSDMEEIVLAKLKTTSRFAKRETSSGKYKDYYKLGIRGNFLFLLEDENFKSFDSLETVSYSDISCIYCIENGEIKSVPADIFFRIYSDYLSSRSQASGIRSINRGKDGI